MSVPTVLSLPQNRYGSSSVTAVGVVTILGGAGALLLALIVGIPSSELLFSKTIHWAVALLMIGFGVLGIATGIGLLRRRHWARVVGIAFAITAFSPGQISSLRSLIGDLMFSVAVPLWCLVVLARFATDAEFSSPTAQTRPPVAISAIAWLLVSSVASVPFLVFRLPFLFMGHALLGWAGTFASLFVYLLDFVAGLALMRRKMAGLWLALGLQVYGICNGVVQDFSPAARVEFSKHISQLLIRLGFPAADLPSQVSGPFFSFVTPLLAAACLLFFWDEYRDTSLNTRSGSIEA